MSDGAPKPTAREFRMLCEKLDRLESLVSQTGRSMEETASLLAAMLSIPTEEAAWIDAPLCRG